MDSYRIYHRANALVKQCGTRDPQKIAAELGIWIYDVDGFHSLLGMYTFRWNHRLIFLNSRLDRCTRQMVLAHEIGHDQEHRELARSEKNGLREFVLFNMKDTTEYEANAFASHILLDEREVYALARQGYDVVQIAQMMDSDINLMLIKMQEMNKLNYDLRIPYDPDSRFFRKIHGSGACWNG